MRSWANFHRCDLSASDGDFFYSTAIQIKDYIHFYGYRRLNLSLFAFLPITPFMVLMFTLAGANRLAAGGKNAR